MQKDLKVMEDVTKKDLLDFMQLAKQQNRGILIGIIAKDMPAMEMIGNPVENIDYKYAYYDKAYDENLKLKANEDIRIAYIGYLN